MVVIPVYCHHLWTLFYFGLENSIEHFATPFVVLFIAIRISKKKDPKFDFFFSEKVSHFQEVLNVQQLVLQKCTKYCKYINSFAVKPEPMYSWMFVSNVLKLQQSPIDVFTLSHVFEFGLFFVVFHDRVSIFVELRETARIPATSTIHGISWCQILVWILSNTVWII
jgi:hypothetical protein